MDLVRREESTIEAIDLIRKRLPGTTFLVLPTVIQELTYIALKGNAAKELADAKCALGWIRAWAFHPLNFIPAGHAITESIALKIRRAGLLPPRRLTTRSSSLRLHWRDASSFYLLTDISETSTSRSLINGWTRPMFQQ